VESDGRVAVTKPISRVQFTIMPFLVQNGIFTTKEKLGLGPDVELHGRRSYHEDFL
jgi:hypothetical protein